MAGIFRNLKAEEIDCRVKTCNENGVSLLLYKDSRCDMNILDKTVGPFNWRRNHKELKGNIYCGVSINVNYNNDLPAEWVTKWDAGAESYTEKEKGEASDSFKRACVNWGIGRELYTAPSIWIKAADTRIEEYDGKYKCKDSFMVRAIEYENDSISYLLVCNKRGEIVYQFGVAEADRTPRTKLIAYCKSNGIDMNDVAAKYELGKDSTDDDYMRALEGLKK